MIFKFRLLSDEAEDFLLDVEVPYDMNLLDFHNFIRQEVGYSPCEMASFFKSDVEWEKLREFTLLDMGFELPSPDDDEDEDDEGFGPPIAMEKVILGQIMHEKFDRLIYVFDMFSERQFFVELLESKASDNCTVYPQTVDRQGQPPKQFMDEQ